MKTNTRLPSLRTHEGGVAKRINPYQELRRTVLACMLWEDSFYESGAAIADRIKQGVAACAPDTVASLASEARNAFKLRHVPLLLVREMARLPSHRHLVADTLSHVIQRPDELAEFVSIYWKDGRCPLSAQVKKGLARAFTKFNAYQLAKYNRDAAVKLRDVLFLCHAKPKDEEQAAVWKQLVDGTLPVPDTWEVALSSGADKRGTWERLLAEDKLGALALLRNLRNMMTVGVPDAMIRTALNTLKPERVLPFRFVSAARHAPRFEPELENAMITCLDARDKLPGHTVLLVDVSGSMTSPISARTELNRIDAACALAILLREICETVEVMTFASDVKDVPPRRGFALRDAIHGQFGGATYLGRAVTHINAKPHDRLIVLTDEQSADRVPDPVAERAYMVNVAAYQNGVGYGKWTNISGWSEAIVDYITEAERPQD